MILSHIYLLLGCAGPYWLAYALCLTPQGSSISIDSSVFYGTVAPLGIISVAVGDAAAAVLGSNCGIWRWPGTHKTLLGTE